MFFKQVMGESSKERECSFPFTGSKRFTISLASSFQSPLGVVRNLRIRPEFHTAAPQLASVLLLQGTFGVYLCLSG